MATSTSDNQPIDVGAEEYPFYVSDPSNEPDQNNVPQAQIAQGTGSGLDADSTDGFHAVSAAKAGPNVLVATDSSGKLPAAILSNAVGSGNATQIQGEPVSATTPTANQVLKFVSGVWTPSTLSSSYNGPSNQTFPSRVLNHVYQNTTGFPMWVQVTITQNSSGSITLEGISDSSSSPSTVVAYAGSAFDHFMSVFFIVLPNNYYEVTESGSSISLTAWVEWY